MNDISLGIGGYVFNLRVAAIMERHAAVLVNQLPGDDFCFLPGGRVAAGETGEEALARELREELRFDFEIGPLAFVCENFFSYAGKPFHEICLFFTVPVKDGFDLRQANEPGGTALFRWLNRSELTQSNIKPEFLVQALGDGPQQRKHFIVRNRLVRENNGKSKD